MTSLAAGPRRREWRRGVVLFGVVALACGGCGGLNPPNGVKAVRQVQDDTGGDDLGVRAVPARPAPDADPEQIVRGFLAASGADDVNDHEVARLFLTPAAAQEWEPAVATTVYDPSFLRTELAAGQAPAVPSLQPSVPAEGQPTPGAAPTPPRPPGSPAPGAAPATGGAAVADQPDSAPGPPGAADPSIGPPQGEPAVEPLPSGPAPRTASVRLSVRVVGTLDASGAYAPVDGTGEVTVTLPLVLSGNQWRLASVPPGLLITDRDLQRSYRRGVVYYLTPDLRALVPETVLLPVGSKGLQSALVRSLLAGPSPWLAPAVRTEFPQGTRLVTTATLVDSVITVDLSGEVAGVPPELRPVLAAQLVATLSDLPGVNGVRITVQNQPLIPGVPVVSELPPGLAPFTLPAPAVLRGGQVQPIGSVTGPLLSMSGVVEAALSADGRQVAALREVTAGRELVVGAVGSDPALVLPAGPYSSPSFTADGSVLLLRAGRLVLVSPGGAAVEVGSQELAAAGPVEAAVLAPDGVRLALVAGPPGQRRVWLAQLRRPRQPGATEVSAGGLRPVAASVTGVTALGWVGTGQVVLVARPPETSPVTGVTVSLAAVDGSRTTALPAGSLPSDVSSVAGQSATDVLAAGEGRLYQLGAGGWISVAAAQRLVG